MSMLLADLARAAAEQAPASLALRDRHGDLSYAEFEARVDDFARGLAATGLERSARVAVLADKALATVVALFGAARAGGVVVPVNPLLRPQQVAYILRDCGVRVLAGTTARLAGLRSILAQCPELRLLVTLDEATSASALAAAGTGTGTGTGRAPVREARSVSMAELVAAASSTPLAHVIDADMAAILYTSGSTGSPKGVVLSHRNLVAGAHSVAGYLGNCAADRILAVLPLSFDYGLSQLTTGLLRGAAVVLHNHLLPAETIRILARERITGLAGVPPLWMQLAALDWPASIDEHLRYFTNSGGAMPTQTLARLRARVPHAEPYLMYGLTEAFRSTYLPPSEVARRPTSIGKAIPNAEVLVLRPDGSECAAGEEGELVHRGALVAMGYWNDAERTAERFRVLPRRDDGLMLPEYAVWSGDTVRRDEDGFLYFVGRRDEMIKTSGYRVSPTEIEEAVFATGLVSEVAAFGVAHAELGQEIVVVARPAAGADADSAALLAACREQLPMYMLPARIDWSAAALPRNPNGKIDRKALQAAHTGRAAAFAMQGQP